MKKLTKKSLDELARFMPVISENQQMGLIGGGMGTLDSPYTIDEFEKMLVSGTWQGGYVEDWGAVLREVTVSSGSYTEDAYKVSEAVSYLSANANNFSTGYCAKYVRMALEAGGLSTEGRPSSACDYDTWLLNNGFEIITGNITPQAGDIVVFEAIEGHKHGHIAMYNGQQWISDFVQRDMYGGSDYRNNPDAKYTILRRK